MIKDRYQPTDQEVTQSRMKPDMFKVSGDTVFATRQGEGITAGEPSVFLRLQNCNLACGFTGGWQCDTGYTWDKTRAEYWQEPVDWSITDTAKILEATWSQGFPNLQNKRVVITGGEPLLQQKKIVQLLPHIPSWEVEIETNGTITPLPALSNCQFNCSPKLENSGNSRNRRYKPETLRFINALQKSQFKFVVSDVTDFTEIDTIRDECELSDDKILIMPEGHTAETVLEHAKIIRGEVDRRGWQLAMRNQLIWYGPKRRT